MTGVDAGRDRACSALAARNVLRRMVLAAVFAAGAACAAPPTGSSAPAGAGAPGDNDGLTSPDGQYSAWMDQAVPPSLDFFRYANGGWIKANPMPADRSYWGVDTLLEQRNQSFIRDLVVSLSKDESMVSGVQRKVADFYGSGMDEAGIEAAGIAPLQPEFDRITGIGNAAELQAEFAHLQLIGVAAPLQLAQMQDFKDSEQVIALAGQAGLGLPDRDYYLKGEPNFAAARSEYLRHVARMFELLGDAPAAADRQSKIVMALETRLARGSMSDVEQRDPLAIYHRMTIADAAAL